MGAGGLGALGGGRIRLVAVLVTVVLAMLPAAAGAASQAPDARLAAVIVRTQPGALAAVARQTERLGARSGGSCRSSAGSAPGCPAARSSAWPARLGPSR